MPAKQGNDGGTIVRRADIVRTREGAGAAGSKKDQGVVGRVKATTCALSRQPLRSPVVSDAMGRLYNKDAVVRYLLKRAESGGSERAATTAMTSSSADDRIAGHLRGLKDVTPLKLEPNPALSPSAASAAPTAAADADDEEAPAQFVCPLTMREMNGRHRFVYIVPSGCVMSESGLRAVVSEQQKKRSPSSSSEDAAAAGESRGKSDEAKCPVSGTPFSAACLGKREIAAGGDVVVLNPTDAEETEMRRAMELAREMEVRRRKELKAAAAPAAAKGVEAGDGDEDTAARKALKKEEKKRRRDEAARLLAAEESEARKAKKLDGAHGPTALTAAGQLAAQAKSSTLANGGKELSAAMRSIYGLDKKKPEGETWMTRGTFNRFA